MAWTIRKATLEDAERITDLAESECNEMAYPFDRCHAEIQIRVLLRLNELFYVAMDGEGKIMGVIGSMTLPNPFNPNVREIREFLWYADSGLSVISRARIMIQLLDQVIKDSEEARVPLHVAMPNVKKTEQLQSLLLLRGFNVTEVYYVKGT